jgi:hypothetical protein
MGIIKVSPILVVLQTSSLRLPPDVKPSPYTFPNSSGYISSNQEPYPHQPYLNTSTSNLHAAVHTPNYPSQMSPVIPHSPSGVVQYQDPRALSADHNYSTSGNFPDMRVHPVEHSGSIGTSSGVISSPPSMIVSGSVSDHGSSKQTMLRSMTPSDDQQSLLSMSVARPPQAAPGSSKFPSMPLLHATPAASSNSLSQQQLELVERLTQLNVPAPTIARMVDNMVVGGPGSVISDSSGARMDDAMEGDDLAPPSYDSTTSPTPVQPSRKQ